VFSYSLQAIHADLVAHASPFNRALGVNAESLFFNPLLPFGQQYLNGMINLRAAIDSYANDFLFMSLLTCIMYPLIWMMRRPSFTAPPVPQPAKEAAESAS